MRWIAGAVAVVFVCGALFAWFSTREAATQTPEPVVAVMIPESRTPPAGMKEYRNAQYRFSIFIPESMSASTTDEGQGATTFIFEDLAAETGFQIFVVPYLDEEVSEERFRSDIPSGVRRGMQDITIDGAIGASFFSEHAALGETAEIWFVQNGYLYEVTTLKPLAQWLSGVMNSWEFIGS